MSVLGIDIGNENCVVATINKGAINIVRNDLSERLTPTLVGFTEKERLIGDNALSKLKSNFYNTCRNIKNLIGKIANDVQGDDIEIHEAYGNLVPCEYGYLGYEVDYKNEKVVFSAARVLSSLLHHLIKMAEKYIGKECKEIVLAYPPMYTNCQKECLLAATKIINANTLRIISDNTAVALDYGMYRMKEFKETEGSLLAFVNIGYANTCVCIARFYSNKCEILCDVADGNLGGRNLDNELIKYMTNVFVNLHKFNPLYKNRTADLCELGTGRLDKYITLSDNSRNEVNNKVRIKLQEVAIKTKKVLSANSDASIHVECLYEDLDCQGCISRSNFEELCGPFFIAKLNNLLNSALEISKVDLKDIQSVEILGGTTRVPFIQQFLQDYFHLPLSKTLIADESVARGCVLSAAMLSKHYKVKEYECIEKITHPIYVEWFNMNDPSSVKRELLYTRECLKKKQKRIVLNEKGQIKLTAFYENTPELPSNCIKELGSCIVKINEKNEKIVESRVMTTFTNYDTFAFVGAETVTKTVIKAKDEKKKGQDKGSEKSKADVEKKGEDNEGETQNEKGKSEEENQEKENEHLNETTNEQEDAKKEKEKATELKKGEEGKVQTSYISVPIEVLLAPGCYTKKDIINFNEEELNMQHNDTLEGERLKNRNELETIIYETRSRLNGMYKDFVVDEERDKILLTLDDLEYWLYDHAEENKNVYIKKKEEIREHIKRIIYRHETYVAKEQNLKHILNHLTQNVISKCSKYASAESQKIIDEANQLISYISEMTQKEQNRKLHEEPLFTLHDVETKLNKVDNATNSFLKKKEAEEMAKKKEEERRQREKERENSKAKEKGKDKEKDKEKDKDDESGEQNEEINENFNEEKEPEENTSNVTNGNDEEEAEV